MDYGRASGFIQANWLTPVKIRTIALTGSFGYLEANYITQELTYYKHNMKEIIKFAAAALIGMSGVNAGTRSVAENIKNASR